VAARSKEASPSAGVSNIPMRSSPCRLKMLSSCENQLIGSAPVAFATNCPLSL